MCFRSMDEYAVIWRRLPPVLAIFRSACPAGESLGCHCSLDRRAVQRSGLSSQECIYFSLYPGCCPTPREHWSKADTEISLFHKILGYSIDLMMHNKRGLGNLTSQNHPTGMNFVNSTNGQIPSSFVIPYQVSLCLSPWLPASHGCREYLSQGAFHVCLQKSYPVVLPCWSLLCTSIYPGSWLNMSETQLQNVTEKGTLLEDSRDCWRGVAWPRGGIRTTRFYLYLYLFFSLSISLTPFFSSLCFNIVLSSQLPADIKKWSLVFSMLSTPQFNHQGGPTPLL